MRKLLALVTTVALPAAAACTVHKSDTPNFTGPSTVAISLDVTATPDTIPQDGVSQSRILVKAFTASGAPYPSLTVHLDMQVGGVSQDFGTLSARDLVTGADGMAIATYVAPPGPSAGGLGTTVTVIATPIGSDAANTGLLNTIGAEFRASLRLTPVGAVTPPASGGTSVTAPTANFIFSPSSPGLNQSVFFNGSSSAAASGHTISAYAWDFGDGATGTGVAPSHAYSRSGTFTVTLVVTDDLGQTGVKSNTVTVANTSSQIVAEFTSSPTDPATTDAVHFDSTTSIASPGATINSWVWDFGDGQTCGTGLTACTGSASKPSHTYGGAVHTWIVRLTIADSAGATATVTHNVTTK